VILVVDSALGTRSTTMESAAETGPGSEARKGIARVSSIASDMVLMPEVRSRALEAVSARGAPRNLARK
jgi:hypothetical protein